MDAALKLVAMDEDDLNVLSAHCQDAVLKPSDLVWLADEQRFALTMNRFAWEAGRKGGLFSRSYERRRSVLHFERVASVRAFGIDRDADDQVLSLLALQFEPGEAPAGEVRIIFAGGSEMRLAVECIEAQLTDLGAAWETRSRPRHARR